MWALYLYYDRSYSRFERWNLGATFIYDGAYRHLCSTRIRLLGWRYLCSALNCSRLNVGTYVRLWIAVVLMLVLTFGIELQSSECWHLCSASNCSRLNVGMCWALNYSRLNVGICVGLWITVVWMLAIVFGFELQSSECWHLCSALNCSRLNVSNCFRLGITVVWMLVFVFDLELQSFECWYLCSALNYSRLNVEICVRLWITVAWMLAFVFRSGSQQFDGHRLNQQVNSTTGTYTPNIIVTKIVCPKIHFKL